MIPATPKKGKKFVSQKWLLKNYVSWSKNTLRRRCEEDGFPFIEDSGGKMFDLDQVDLWFKQRKGEVA